MFDRCLRHNAMAEIQNMLRTQFFQNDGNCVRHFGTTLNQQIGIEISLQRPDALQLALGIIKLDVLINADGIDTCFTNIVIISFARLARKTDDRNMRIFFLDAGDQFFGRFNYPTLKIIALNKPAQLSNICKTSAPALICWLR